MQKFPHGDTLGGDTLGVVFSFLSAYELLQGSLFLVCKEWYQVLCELPHAWSHKLDLVWIMEDFPRSRFAWHRITVSYCFNGCGLESICAGIGLL